MAMGRRRWGRQPRTAAQTPLTAGGGAPAREVTRVEELTVRSGWPLLPAETREALLRPYEALAGPAPRRAGLAAGETAETSERTTQDWIAALLEAGFQRSALSVVQTWLAGGAPDAHLAVYGATGRGRTSAVAALARRAMRGRPSAPDACYVPDPDAPAHWTLVTAPTGTGVSFCEAFNAAVHQIAQRWEKVRERPRAEGADEAAEESALETLVREQFARVGEGAGEPARAYLERLARALLEAQAGTPFPITVDADCPAGRPVPGEQAAGALGEAPVLVASLARTELTRLLLRANGGVLIISASDLVDRDQPTNEWGILRAVLRTGSLAMRPIGEPQVPVDVRVALVGATTTLRVLERSEEYARLFRYRAIFEDSAPWTAETEAAYAALCGGVARAYGVPPFDHAAVGALIEEGARRTLVYHRSRVTSDLALLRDLSVEAGRLAQERERTAANAAGADGGETLAGVTTTAADVEAVLARRREVYSRPARESREDILEGRTIVPTTGTSIGQITGLTVVTVTPPGADARFGVPFRLTVTVTPGRERLVDVEREAEYADRSHIAGALTMAGYLAWRYGHDRPIHAVARLRFEQGGATAGPSASAAELYALLSALAGVPIRASVAVTGAVGQHGEVQVIGGVAEKIEGFWQICRARRQRGEVPDGAYGVLVPAANLGDVLLRPEVAQAIVDEGWFHIWPISDIDQGISLLTGMAAPALHARVDATLARYHQLALSDPASRG